MKSTRTILWAALLFALSSALLSEDISAKSVISSVIIYPDRATVTREASFSLGPGVHTIVFDGLPPALIPNSLRVVGRGTAVIKILGLDLTSQFLESPLLPEIKRLQGEIESLLLEIAKAKDSLEVLETQEKFLKSIEVASTSRASQEVATGKPDVQSWEKVISFLGTKLQEVKKSKSNTTTSPCRSSEKWPI